MANINFSSELTSARLQIIVDQQVELRRRAAVPPLDVSDLQASGQIWLLRGKKGLVMVQPLHLIGQPDKTIIPLVTGNISVRRRSVVCYTSEGNMVPVDPNRVAAVLVKSWLPRNDLSDIKSVFPKAITSPPL